MPVEGLPEARHGVAILSTFGTARLGRFVTADQPNKAESSPGVQIAGA